MSNVRTHTSILLVVLLCFIAISCLRIKEPEERDKKVQQNNIVASEKNNNYSFSSLFEPVPAPQPGDWLDVHDEPGQTLDEFKKEGWNEPDATRNRIYLQPLEAFKEGSSPSLSILKELIHVYFQLEVIILPPLVSGKQSFTTRINTHTKKKQILSGDILAFLKNNIPHDAFCVLGVTMQDLYPDDSWNFVFGYASYEDRTGVFSFARFDPAFYGEKQDELYEHILLKRSTKILVHEIGHTFGLAHCIYYKCIMNGSNHLDESDAQPLHMCPVDIGKLKFSIGFDESDRYQQLEKIYKKRGFEKESIWVQKRLESIAH